MEHDDQAIKQQLQRIPYFKESLMKKKSILFALLLITLQPSFAQFEKAGYSWAKDPEKITLTEAELKEPAIYLKNYRFIEYAYTDAEEREVAIYYTVHRHARINHDDAIQSFNKVYIPMRNVLDVVDVKARTINPKGEVKVLNKSDIKDQKDEEGNEYKIFALEGIEKGSEVEYIYTVKKRFVFYGREYFQGGTFSRDNKFELISPRNLVFKCKGYNGFPVLSDTATLKKNFLAADIKNITRLKEEKYSVYNANLMRIDYRLEYNTARDRTPLFSLANLANDIAKKYSDDGSKQYKKELKKIKGLIKDLKLDKLNEEDQKVKALEVHLKQTIAYVEDQPIDDNVEFTLKNRYADESGLLRIYSIALREMGIPFEIVFTNDRNDSKLDPDFFTYNQLQYALLYFPNTRKYMTPTSFQYRYGIIPNEYTANYGVFIKIIDIGGLTAGLGETRYIEPLPFDESFDNLDISMELDENSDKLKMTIIRSQAGYYASVFPIIPLLKEEDKNKLKEELFLSLIPDAELKSTEYLNKDFTGSTADTVYKLKGVMISGALVERAGNKLLFKIGESIGPQDQLYQEEERKTNVENTWNRLYYRKLTFTIPEGYKINNPDDLKMNVTCSDNGKEVFAFVSTYKIEGSKLIVDVNEYYKQINFPRERFEEFRKVINAAADFNKVILVLEKK
jgi:hypothetical protein